MFNIKHVVLKTIDWNFKAKYFFEILIPVSKLIEKYFTLEYEIKNVCRDTKK